MTTTFGAKGRARRAELVDLGRCALVDGGLSALVLRDVAARAGMTLGNLQYYFRSRDDLIEAVVRDCFADDLDAIRAVAADRPDLGELADRLFGQWAGDSGVVFAVLALLARHEERFAALHQEVYAAFACELTGVLRHADPSASDDELAVRARLVTALFDGLALQGIGARPGSDAWPQGRAWEAGKALVAALASGCVGPGAPNVTTE